jgi:aminoglycoside phosphotransferase (APT) family kinase protein
MDTLMDKLAADVPPDSGSVIVHGDFRLDNAVVDLTGPPRIAAVLDWELSTLGDPLADLGVTLTYWQDLGDAERAKIPVAVGLTALPGFPAGRELAGRYAALAGRDLGGLPFYRALGAMKLAVILEGVHSRYLGRQSIGEGYATAGVAVPVLVARGLSILSPASMD